MRAMATDQHRLRKVVIGKTGWRYVNTFANRQAVASLAHHSVCVMLTGMRPQADGILRRRRVCVVQATGYCKQAGLGLAIPLSSGA